MNAIFSLALSGLAGPGRLFTTLFIYDIQKMARKYIIDIILLFLHYLCSNQI